MVTRATRGISWIKAAPRAFGEFPEEVRSICLDALTIAAEGGNEVWVVHAFQKKSKKGIKTPARDIGLVKDRLKALREMLR